MSQMETIPAFTKNLKFESAEDQTSTFFAPKRINDLIKRQIFYCPRLAFKQTETFLLLSLRSDNIFSNNQSSKFVNVRFSFLMLSLLCATRSFQFPYVKPGAN